MLDEILFCLGQRVEDVGELPCGVVKGARHLLSLGQLLPDEVVDDLHLMHVHALGCGEEGIPEVGGADLRDQGVAHLFLSRLVHLRVQPRHGHDGVRAVAVLHVTDLADDAADGDCADPGDGEQVRIIRLLDLLLLAAVEDHPFRALENLKAVIHPFRTDAGFGHGPELLGISRRFCL